MKTFLYLLAAFSFQLSAFSAASPTMPPTRIAAGSGVTVTTNGINDFTLSASGGVGTSNGFATNLSVYSSGTTTRALRVFLGTQTNSNPVEVLGTWNAAGTTFSAATISVTDTASAAASTFLDLQSNGVTRLSIRKNGQVLLPTTSAALP